MTASLETRLVLCSPARESRDRRQSLVPTIPPLILRQASGQASCRAASIPSRWRAGFVFAGVALLVSAPLEIVAASNARSAFTITEDTETLTVAHNAAPQWKAVMHRKRGGVISAFHLPADGPNLVANEKFTNPFRGLMNLFYMTRVAKEGGAAGERVEAKGTIWGSSLSSSVRVVSHDADRVVVEIAGTSRGWRFIGPAGEPVAAYRQTYTFRADRIVCAGELNWKYSHGTPLEELSLISYMAPEMVHYPVAIVPGGQPEREIAVTSSHGDRLPEGINHPFTLKMSLKNGYGLQFRPLKMPAVVESSRIYILERPFQQEWAQIIGFIGHVDKTGEKFPAGQPVAYEYEMEFAKLPGSAARPHLVIKSPARDTKCRLGEAVAFEVTATDVKGQPLPPESIKWEIYRGSARLVKEHAGASVTCTIPSTQAEWASPWMTATATVTDSEGRRAIEYTKVDVDLTAPPVAASAPFEWSCGYGRMEIVDGLPLVASWGGGAYSARATARIGRLMLREGNWEGRQLLSAEAVRQITTDVGTPGPNGMGWWSNNDGHVAALPRDAFWGAGAGGQVVLVVPSMKIVAVRNGGSLEAGNNDVALEKCFFTPLAQVLASAKTLSAGVGHVDPNALSGSTAEFRRVGSMLSTSMAPARIKEIVWAPKDSIIRRAKGGDNWPMTWGDDGALYTAYGDGNGFEPFIAEKLSLGLATVTGEPPNFQGINLRAPSVESVGNDVRGHKASGILMVDGVLYLLARNRENAQLAWSRDHGATWTWADWKFTESFGAPTFINFGPNYAGARDDFVYVVSHDANTAYETADAFVLARVPRDRVHERTAWEFFAGVENAGPQWTRDIARRAAVLKGPGQCYRVGVTYNAALKRYLLVQPVRSEASRDRAGKIDTRFVGGLAVYEAPEPWGPWTVVFQTDHWDVGPGETASFPQKWMSADGRTLHLVFSGDDYFSVRQATLVMEDGR